jgi:hypothetical protein
VKLEAQRVIDQLLVAEEPCLGAAFCSYTFDPAYFEDHVLRALLRLRGDPAEDGARYHEEARAALQETPVACVVDASVRQGGRRLPYDLLLVRARVFHPKVIVALYASEARVAVGSGNLTKSGIEGNTELFFVRALKYNDPADALFLQGIDAFLGECASLAGMTGTQLPMVREALQRRIVSTAPLRDRDRIDARFVSSFEGAMLDHLKAVLPDDARISRVGVLAPFFEQDDLDAGSEESGLSSVLRKLFALRPSEGATLDVGVPWDDASLVAPPTAELPTLDAHCGSLWAHRIQERVDGATVERMAHFVPEKVGERRVEARDAAGTACRFEREALDAQIAARRLWPVTTPTVFAPARILRRLADEHPVSLWLHPSVELAPPGRPRRRPLHAKVFLVTVVRRGQTLTWVLMGSANASRAALGRSVARGGNAEAGVLCCFEGEVTLHDLLPTLVAYRLDGVSLVEREPMAVSVDLSAWVSEVVHDAAARTLTVAWRETGPGTLGAWTLAYLDRDLARGEGRPDASTVITDFDLAAASAEVTFRSAEREWSLPIRVADLAALPLNPQLTALGLRELLALLGRRVGAERLASLRAERGVAGVASVLDAVFGEGFGPTDVFRAWWGAAQDLSTAPTLASFRNRLVGATGALAAWSRLAEAANASEQGDEQTRDEIWVYGGELLRELTRVSIPDGPDQEAKRTLVQEACAQIRRDLGALDPQARARTWFSAVQKFYGLGGPCEAT